MSTLSPHPKQDAKYFRTTHNDTVVLLKSHPKKRMMGSNPGA